MGGSSLLQGIFPNQGLNPCPLHCKQIPYKLSHKGETYLSLPLENLLPYLLLLPHLNVEFQRIARRDKKAFLNGQCKEIEENKRMGNNRDLNKLRDAKGTFHTKMGTIKDRNGMNLTEAEDINRWQEYTEELYKFLDNHYGVITTWSQTSWNAKLSGL